MVAIQHEKLAQAIEILNEHNVDVWLTFVRETSHNADPALALILGFDVTWQSAFVITKAGQKIAIVGRYDVENVQRMGAYDSVFGYDEGIRTALRTVLADIGAQTIALNFSTSDSAADGLSHGMYLALVNYLSDMPYTFISAENVLRAVRGRKSITEIERIRAAVQLTETIIDEITGYLRAGLSEKEIADWIHGRFAHYGVTPAWEPAYCPIVNCGPDSPIGHSGPSETYIAQPGHLIHIDLGVTLDDYVSDIQRVWYLQPADETEIPAEILRGFQAVTGAIKAAAEVLRPGIRGYEVDTVARDYIVEMGYPAYQHALGHGIGRTVHDGATLLGPRWERYGNTPEGIVEAGNIFTLELGVEVANHGAVSLEEDVLVTDNGIEWLMPPQLGPIVIKC